MLLGCCSINEMKSPCCFKIFPTIYQISPNKILNTTTVTILIMHCLGSHVIRNSTSVILNMDNPLYHHPNFISNTHHLVARCDYPVVEWVCTISKIIELRTRLLRKTQGVPDYQDNTFGGITMDKESLCKNGPLSMFVGDSNSKLKANNLLTWIVSNYSMGSNQKLNVSP